VEHARISLGGNGEEAGHDCNRDVHRRERSRRVR
jgi:hypothetical protein